MSICTSSLHTTVSLSYHPLAARPPGARARAHPDHSWPWSSEALLAGHAVWARFERPLALLHRPQPAPRPAAPTLQHRWGRRRPRPPSLAPAPPMARRNPDPRHVARDLNKIHPPWRYSSRWAQFKWARVTSGRSKLLPLPHGLRDESTALEEVCVGRQSRLKVAKAFATFKLGCGGQ